MNNTANTTRRNRGVQGKADRRRQRELRGFYRRVRTEEHKQFAQLMREQAAVRRVAEAKDRAIVTPMLQAGASEAEALDALCGPIVDRDYRTKRSRLIAKVVIELAVGDSQH
jgi:hypothetical protein